ncbi:MAG TPA: hypothetical protein VKO16_03660, partial [Polyangia bacterium]|nr:hypothetical protein [Polyangia bacterium]
MPDTNPSGAFGAGTPKIVLVALDRCAASGEGVCEGATPGGVTRAVGGGTTGIGVDARGAAGCAGAGVFGWAAGGCAAAEVLAAL